MKSPVTHLVWCVAAAGAFAGGIFWQKSQTPASAATSTTSKPTAQGVTASTSGKPGPTAIVPAGVQGIAEFTQRYTHADGTPLSAEEMKAAMTEVLTESDPIKSSLMFALILDQLSPENAKTVMEEIKARVSGFEGMRFYGLLAYKWGSVDGAGAMAEAVKQEGPAKMMSSVASIAGWATKDPAAAQAWLVANPPGNEWEKAAAERGLVSGLARTDSAAAEKYVSEIKDKGERARLTQVIVEEKLKQGTESAAAWAASLTDPDMKKGAFESVAEQMYRNDPQKAMEYVKANAAESYSSGAVGELARRLGGSDPQQALTFSQGLPEGATRSEAYKSTFREWANSNPTEASTQLNSMPKGADRDAAASGLARSVAREDSAGAIAWAESIGDPAIKQESLQEVLQRTFRTDPEAANAYMTTNGWTEEQQKAVKSAPEGGPGRGFGGGFGRGPR